MSKLTASAKDFYRPMSHWEQEKGRALLASEASGVKWRNSMCNLRWLSTEPRHVVTDTHQTGALLIIPLSRHLTISENVHLFSKSLIYSGLFVDQEAEARRLKGWPADTQLPSEPEFQQLSMAPPPRGLKLTLSGIIRERGRV